MQQAAAVSYPTPIAGAVPQAVVRPASRWNVLLIALCGVMLQYVWRVQEMFPALRFVQFTAMVSLATVALFFLSGGLTHRLHQLRHPLYRLILWLLLLAVLTIPTSLRVGDSVRFLTGNFAKTVLQVGILVASVRDRRDIDRLLRVFVIGAGAYVAASVAFAQPGAGRLGGGSYDPNDLGLFIVCTIPLCVYMLRRAAPWTDKLAALVSVAFLLTGTILSGSRGGFLALVAVALYGLLGLKAVRVSKRLTVLTVIAATMAIAGGDAYWERISTVLAPQEDYNWEGKAESGRIEVWKRGLGYMLDRPFLGVGVDQFDVAEGTLSPLASRQSRGIGLRWSAAHNSYVQIGAELGVGGLVLFLCLLGTAFRVARRIGRKAIDKDDRFLGQCFAALVVGYAVGCTFLSQAYSTYLYFIVGLLIAMAQHTRVQLRRPVTIAPIQPEPATPAFEEMTYPRVEVGRWGLR